jgi:pimeloyl-ACP methyl ester carboxylesterase
LATADPSPAVVYLGRPCQYLDAAALSVCDAAWWVNRRFASEVVDAYDEVLTRLKSRNGVNRLRLIGHSGGGVIAALLALRRTDVEQLITVAAPLALSEWVSGHDMAPLDGSLDPARQPGRLPQAVHWVGGQDKIVPQAVIEAFIQRKGGRIRTVSTYGHECCWDRNWAAWLKEIQL